jgi:phosphate transport system protein
VSKVLEQQIKDLKQDFATMGFGVAEAIKCAIDSIKEHDLKLAQKVIADDEVINEQETRLEKKSAQIIALQQPVAGDLREIVAILKASSDLERLADHAISIARITEKLNTSDRDFEIEDLLFEMAANIQQMLADILKAYTEMDDKFAVEVAARDSKNDEYFRKVSKVAVKKIQNTPEFALEGIDYLNMANHLERMGDYITNVAEWIVYTNIGKITELGRNDY